MEIHFDQFIILPELTGPLSPVSMANSLRSVFQPPQNLLLLLLLVPFVLGGNDFQKNFCGTNGSGNFTVNSTYDQNLKSLLSSISSDNSGTNGFYNLSSGQSPDLVHGIALCRGDLALPDCQVCLKNASNEIVRLCPLEKVAFIWYDNCMLRYSNEIIFGVTDSFHVFWTYNEENVTSTSVSEFNRSAMGLMDQLRKRAAAGNSTLKFATGDATGPDSMTLYGLAQCTPDLSELQCNNCLDKAINDTSLCCAGKRGGRVIGPNCNIRFEVNRFYDPSAEAPWAPVASPPVSPPIPSVSPPNPSTSRSDTNNENSSSLLLIKGIGDLLVHHVIALCSHITALILLKVL